MGVINPETGLAYNNKRGYRYGTYEYYRNHSLLQKYGISLLEWEALFDSQGRVCAICDTDEKRGKNWHTDHNHVTGKIRGILCGWCNTALGKFQENKELLRKAAAYIDEHNE